MDLRRESRDSTPATAKKRADRKLALRDGYDSWSLKDIVTARLLREALTVEVALTEGENPKLHRIIEQMYRKRADP
jgi:hypothetical protein